MRKRYPGVQPLSSAAERPEAKASGYLEAEGRGNPPYRGEGAKGWAARPAEPVAGGQRAARGEEMVYPRWAWWWWVRWVRVVWIEVVTDPQACPAYVRSQSSHGFHPHHDPILLKAQMRILGGDKAGRVRAAFQVIPPVGPAIELLLQGPLQGQPADGQFHGPARRNPCQQCQIRHDRRSKLSHRNILSPRSPRFHRNTAKAEHRFPSLTRQTSHKHHKFSHLLVIRPAQPSLPPSPL